MHTYGALRAGFVGFLPQKFPYHSVIYLNTFLYYFLRFMSKENGKYGKNPLNELFSVEQLK